MCNHSPAPRYSIKLRLINDVFGRMLHGRLSCLNLPICPFPPNPCSTRFPQLLRYASKQAKQSKHSLAEANLNHNPTYKHIGIKTARRYGGGR